MGDWFSILIIYCYSRELKYGRIMFWIDKLLCADEGVRASRVPCGACETLCLPAPEGHSSCIAWSGIPCPLTLSIHFYSKHVP